MKELKPHTSVREQISLLKSRGLVVEDEDAAECTLRSINYYRFSGYLFGFRDKKTGIFSQEITFEKAKRIYDFDRRFSHVLLFVLEDIEETFKTRYSYSITEEYPKDPCIYLKPNIYRDYDTYLDFQKRFYNAVDQNQGIPFVRHHKENYGGQIPMWVAVELFTMGNLCACYKNLIPYLQKKIAKLYGTGPRQLGNWLQNITYTRNHLAHYMRVYDYDFARTPMECKKHLYPYSKTNRIFDQIFIMSVMYSDTDEWNRYVICEIQALFEEYNDVISLKKLGFPATWAEVLKK